MLKEEGYGDCKMKIRRAGDLLEIYCTRGIHSLKLDCFDALNFPYHLYTARILGEGSHVMPAILTVNDTLRYLNLSRLVSNMPDNDDSV